MRVWFHFEYVIRTHLALFLRGVHGLVGILAFQPNAILLHAIEVIHEGPHALYAPIAGSAALGAQH